ncbi:MAG: c-type cytochrome [bacterium]|nr:c-type cytochrome [bacterium]
MAIPTEKLYNTDRLNVWFAISSVILLVSTLWLAWVDYARPWHKYQDEYMDAQAGLAHLDYLQAEQESARQQLAAAAAAVEAAHAQVAAEDERRRAQEAELANSAPGSRPDLEDRVAQSPSRASMDAALLDLDSRCAAVSIDFGAADAIIQVTANDYEHTLGEYGPDHTKTQAALAQLEAERAELNTLRADKEQIEDRQNLLRAKLAALDEPVAGAQRQYDQLAKVAADAAKKEDQYSNKFVKAVINPPFGDFVAPKGTPSRREVRQLVLPEVRQRLNYLDSYTTDRCTTCHLAIDNPEFSQDQLAAKLEASLTGINDERRRQGRDPVPSPSAPKLTGEDVPKLEPGRVAEHWGKLSDEQQSDYFHVLLDTVNTHLTESGRPPLDLGQPVMAHPDLELFVSIDSPHPMAQMGCTVCHEGNPQEVDFVLAAHTPADHEQEHDWEQRHYVRRLGVPNATFALVEHYWDRPMLLGKYTEASCAKCHTEVTDIGSYENKPQGRNINLGENLFVNSGCINCHKVEGLEESRRVGPDLTHVAAKLEPGFTDRWVFNPRKFRPSTWMPHFFGQENNGPAGANEHDPDPVLRTETEVLAMRTYLYSLSTDWQAEPIPEGLEADPENGRTLFKEVGCLACHSNLTEYGEDWIVQDMQKRRGKTPEQAQADFDALTYNQRVQYAWDNFASDRDTVFHPEGVRFDPERDYNVPVFTRSGPELSAVGSKVSVEWLYGWLRDPRSYSSDTKMPRLRLTEQEALDVASYLTSLKHDEFDAEPIELSTERRQMADDLIFGILTSQRSHQRSRQIMDDEGGELTAMLSAGLAKSEMADEARTRFEAMDTQTKRIVFLGSKMITHYGCYTCHLVPGFETATRPGTELTTWAEKPISQLDFAFFDPAFEDLRAKHVEEFDHIYPPDQTDLITLAHGNDEQEITHTHGSFAYHKMRNPRIWDRKKIKKPYDKLKMPNFYFSEDEADALVTYLMGRRPPRVTESLQIDYDKSSLGAIAAGRRLTRELNCVGCHQIEDNVAPIHQYYRTRVGGTEYFDEVNAPPYLRGEGAKIQHSWFYGFLNNVEDLRPWLNVRMPTFYLTNEQTTTLVKYFAGLSQYESDDLERRLRAVHGYMAKAPAADDETDPLPAGHDWYEDRMLRPAAAYLGGYAVENRLVGPYDLDPADADPDDLARAYLNVVDRTGFIHALYDVPYPFVDAPRPLVADEQFGRGEELLFELGCLKCHVLGDPNIEGSNPSPTAPNLNLTFRRLRQEWVRQWLRNPAWIQPGTKMPQLFPEGKSAFAWYGDEQAALEAKFGTTSEDQIELLLDYLYNAGLKNHTAVQPGGIAPPPADTGDDEFMEDDEEFDEDDEFFEEDEDDG